MTGKGLVAASGKQTRAPLSGCASRLFFPVVGEQAAPFPPWLPLPS